MTRSTESGRIMLIRKEFAEDGVLIELYWNVNFPDGLADRWLGSINRTILECKCRADKKYPNRLDTGINRTILECKLRIRLICRSV